MLKGTDPALAKKNFVSDQVLKKPSGKAAADLIPDAEAAYDAAVGEIEAYNKDVSYMAIAQF